MIASNVVRLPTAAARKPRTPSSKTLRKCKPECLQFTGETLDPWQRRALRNVKLIDAATKDTNTCLLFAIINSMDDLQATKVGIWLEILAETETGQQAIAMFRFHHKPTVGDRCNLEWARRYRAEHGL